MFYLILVPHILLCGQLKVQFSTNLQYSYTLCVEFTADKCYSTRPGIFDIVLFVSGVLLPQSSYTVLVMMLLLLSGDVELNPGPSKFALVYCCVGSDSILHFPKCVIIDLTT